MTHILILLAVLSALGFAFCLALLLRARKRRNRLHEAVNIYLRDGAKIDFSLHDDSWSMLENDIAELLQLLEREKGNARALVCENNAFLADVSHQLKTPLAGIRLYCEMALQPDRTDVQACMHKQLALLERTDKLVYNLLRLEKLRTETYRMDMHDEKCEDICRSVLNNLAVLYPKKKFTLTGAAMLHCDRQWMYEAIENIVKNACEHTDEQGSVTLDISHAERSVILSVEDNGGGMDEQTRRRLFERFYRTDTAKPNSTGLGLAITRAITERHHGTLSAENGTHGMKFVFCLPQTEGIKKLN